jgi:hypothetical protein
MIRQFRYDRFASKLDNGSIDAYDVDPVRGLMKIPWPDIRKKKLGAGEFVKVLVTFAVRR